MTGVPGLIIRPYQNEDLPFLIDMFFESLYVPESEQPFERSILDKPELNKYIKDWGRASDHCYIAMFAERRIGAVWSRFFDVDNPSYGFVSKDIPELGIALISTYRNQGIGEQLIKRLELQLKNEKIQGISLSVDMRNSAMRLYNRLGFEIIEQNGNSVTMLLKW